MVATKPRKRPLPDTKTPSFRGLKPSSGAASTVAKRLSRACDTQCEVVLRRELWRQGLRYRRCPSAVVGRPDIVFRMLRIAVFCDGDFWHGRNLEARIEKLQRGHNSNYWTAKLRRNVERDREINERLAADGWTIVRLWESDIMADPARAAESIVALVKKARSAASRTMPVA